MNGNREKKDGLSASARRTAVTMRRKERLVPRVGADVPDPFPQLILQRVARVRAELAAAIWNKVGPVSVMGSRVLEAPIDAAAAAGLRFSPVAPGSHFGPPRGGWKQRWFAVEVAPPPRGVVRHFFWKCQGETTVYHRGHPWAGLDVCHASCPLPPGGGRLLLDCGTYQTAIWVPREEIGEHGLRFDGAYLADRDEDAWQAHHDLEVLAQMAEHLAAKCGWKSGSGGHVKPDMPAVPPLLRILIAGLAETAEAWDSANVTAARRALETLLRRLPAERWQPRAILAGHSHMDLVWMWPEREGERKALHTIATMVRLLEAHPEFHVIWNQPAVISAVRRRAPALLKDVDRFVREGRWEYTGGMEVESELQMPCGEALARAIAYGQRRLARLRGGSLPTVLWLPDSFGYPACLPQLMRLAGLEGFFTMKMLWSQVTEFPHTSFVWRGSDGSEVIAHQSVRNRMDVDRMLESAERDRQCGVHGEYLSFVGTGDGGGGTTETEIVRIRRFSSLAGAPRAKWGRVEDFFARLRGNRNALPVIQGEFYLERHRGTFTTQSDFKAAYRALERALQAREAALAARGGKAPGYEVWKRLLFAQFHDALPGSSIQLVYDEMIPELRRLADENRAATADVVAGPGGGWSVFNPVPMPAKRVVDLGEGVPAGLFDAASAHVPTQRVGSGKRTRTLAFLNLPAAGTVTLRTGGAVGRDPGDAPPVRAGIGELDNGIVRAGFDASGRLTVLENAGARLPLTRPSAFTLHVDRGDAWEIDREAEFNGVEIAGGLALRATESGPLRAVLSGSAAVGAASRMTVRYILEAGSRWLRVEAEVDWREAARMLKYRLPTNCRGSMARYGTPFGSILRPQLPGYPREEAMWEVPGNRWAAVLDDAQSSGVAIVTEAKYGFSCRDGELALTLLRSSMDSSETRPRRADQGLHVIRFAVGAHADLSDAQGESTAAAAETLFADIVVANGQSALQPGFTLVNPGSLVACWLAPAEDGRGIILRLHETAGRSGTAELRTDDTGRKVEYVDLLERRTDAPARSGRGRWRIEYGAYRVMTLRIE